MSLSLSMRGSLSRHELCSFIELAEDKSFRPPPQNSPTGVTHRTAHITKYMTNRNTADIATAGRAINSKDH